MIAKYHQESKWSNESIGHTVHNIILLWSVILLLFRGFVDSLIVQIPKEYITNHFEYFCVIQPQSHCMLMFSLNQIFFAHMWVMLLILVRFRFLKCIALATVTPGVLTTPEFSNLENGDFSKCCRPLHFSVDGPKWTLLKTNGVAAHICSLIGSSGSLYSYS